MKWVSSKHELWRNKDLLNPILLNKGLKTGKVASYEQRIEFYELNIKLLSLEVSVKIDKDDLLSLAKFILKEFESPV